LQPFATLDYNGQLERLTDAARSVLPHYGLDDARVQPELYVNNAVFRVETSNGKRYALRLHRNGYNRINWIHSELDWLYAIHQETPLCAPVPAASGEGKWLTMAQVEGLDEAVVCTLLAWIDGQPIQWNTIQAEQVRQAGAYLAQLHNFSMRFMPPPDFARPRLDWEGLFGEDSPYNPGEGAAIFTPEQREIFAQVEARVGKVMNTLGQTPATFGLIHADFIVKNFLFDGDTLCAIDFDDCGWGYYLYDLAPLLTQMKGEPNYAAIADAYWEGYTGVRPLSNQDRSYLEVFIAARHLASCRWIAGNLHNPNIRERAADVIAARTIELRRFLETGAISQRGEQF
jgi:Ser/Thr protein kinase RdoA (MazF antagonist)